MNTLARRSALAGLVAAATVALSASGAAATATPSDADTASATAQGAATLGAPYLRTELYFGSTTVDGGEVTPEEFDAFLDKEVTPQFPDGLTVLTGAGQWRGGSGEIIKERSYLLILLYPAADQAANGEIEEIREDYKRLYDQESVLRADSVERVSF